MSFDVAADAYDRFMGRYSQRLAPVFADFAGVAPTGETPDGSAEAGDGRVRVLDVGCGPGALTAELVARVGTAGVVAVDPSPSFVSAVAARHPDVEVGEAAAEALPFESGTFAAALAQLVVHFMSDPVAGLAEMGRVTRPGGTVAACVWDHHGGAGPLNLFWSAVHELDPAAQGEARLAGAREGSLAQLLQDAGLREVEDGKVAVEVEHATFDDWWEPYTLGVGPAGAYVANLDADRREALRDLCRRRLPGAPFTVSASAWAARAKT